MSPYLGFHILIMIGNNEDANLRQICAPLQVDFQVYHLKDEEDDEVANTAHICPLQNVNWTTDMVITSLLAAILGCRQGDVHLYLEQDVCTPSSRFFF